MAVETLLAQTAREVADAKETNDTHLYLMDGVSSPERMRGYYQVPLSWLTPQEWRRFWRIMLVQVLVGLGLLALLIWYTQSRTTYIHEDDLGTIRQFE
jgi:hypothetical protein